MLAQQKQVLPPTPPALPPAPAPEESLSSGSLTSMPHRLHPQLQESLPRLHPQPSGGSQESGSGQHPPLHLALQDEVTSAASSAEGAVGYSKLFFLFLIICQSFILVVKFSSFIFHQNKIMFI